MQALFSDGIDVSVLYIYNKISMMPGMSGLFRLVKGGPGMVQSGPEGMACREME